MKSGGGRATLAWLVLVFYADAPMKADDMNEEICATTKLYNLFPISPESVFKNKRD